jgi:NADH-quinone oxidoreductase subunit A
MDSQSAQLNEYIPVLMLFGVAVAAAAGMLIGSVVLGRWANKGRLLARSKNKNINTPYECGMIAVGEGNTRLSVKFYLVAMLFILFDIEVVFMYPWAVVYRDMLATNGPLILGSMISFLGILFIGYIYALKKKAFDWKS